MKIIVIVDAQNDFINGALGSKEAQIAADNIVNYLNDYEEPETLVLFTKDTHYEDYLETLEGKNLPIEHCINGTSGWSIYKPISRAVDYNYKFWSYSSKEIRKGRILKGTFGSISLAKMIEEICTENKVEEVKLMGFCTDICIISNALLLKAYCPETPITVVESCCAGTTPEAHEAALKVMRSCQINMEE